jgi:aubergine
MYYNVLHDNFYEKRPDIMQSMTFKLCHNYYNWSGTTKIPSVVQYAKKLATLVGQYMHQIPSAEIPIENQLYFL